MQSQAKLWLLQNGDRHNQFKITENIFLRLNIYPFLVSFLLLVCWTSFNPDLMLHGLRALILSALWIVALDYCSGFVFQGAKFTFLIIVLLKMGFMSAMVFIHFNLMAYVSAVVFILTVCVFARNRAKSNFLAANFSARAT